MKENTFEVIISQHVKAGEETENGYGRYMTAPAEAGFYTLYEIGYTNTNTHAGWRWERES